MEKTRQYSIEGVLLEIPLRYDEVTGREIEIFPDFIENPVYTPDGCPVLFTGRTPADTEKHRMEHHALIAAPAASTGKCRTR